MKNFLYINCRLIRKNQEKNRKYIEFFLLAIDLEKSEKLKKSAERWLSFLLKKLDDVDELEKFISNNSCSEQCKQGNKRQFNDFFSLFCLPVDLLEKIKWFFASHCIFYLIIRKLVERFIDVASKFLYPQIYWIFCFNKFFV